MSGRKWTFGGLAGAVVLACGVGGLPAQPPAGVKPPAVVNGQVISQADLEAAMQRVGPMVMQMTEAQRKQFQAHVLGNLIEQALMHQFLARNNVVANANEVNRKLAETEAMLKNQGKTLADVLRETNQSEEQLRADITRFVQWQTYAKQHLTDADVEQFYKDNKDFFDHTTVRVSHIFLPLPATPTESDRAQARAKLADLRGQILAGKLDFAEAAKLHSKGPTADRGGDIGFIMRKYAVEESFARAAFALQVGQVSDIVVSEYGLQIIKVTDRKPGQPSDFTKIKDAVWQMCIGDLALNVLAQQHKAAKIEVNLQ
jgi:parvulin-like peptidyl-prolyl isomerase